MTRGPYAIAWAPSAQRDVTRLPEKVATAVVEFCYGSLADNPQRVGHELHLDLAGQYAARRGDYRLIYRIEHQSRRVTILAVAHRADVYRPHT